MGTNSDCGPKRTPGQWKVMRRRKKVFWTFKLTMATSTASGLERERSQSRRSEWSLARPRVSLRYRSSKQMFSTVVPCTGRKTGLKEPRERCRKQLCSLSHHEAE